MTAFESLRAVLERAGIAHIVYDSRRDFTGDQLAQLTGHAISIESTGPNSHGAPGYFTEFHFDEAGELRDVGLFGPADAAAVVDDGTKDRLLAEVKEHRAILYHALFAVAQKVTVTDNAVVLTIAAGKHIEPVLAAGQVWLDQTASAAAGRPMAVQVATVKREADRLRARVMGDPSVQALLEVFPAEIRFEETK